MIKFPDLDVNKHVAFILGLEEKSKTSDALYFTDHKRLSGVYWAVSSLHLLQRLDSLPKERIIDFTMSCYHEDEGAFSGNADQDAHLLYTLSGVQILAMYGALERVDGARIAKRIGKLQQADGSFAGDDWGEVDTRFTYCAALTLSILGRMEEIDVESAIEFVLGCQNFDGGFGCIPGAESHAGQVFCCVGALALCGGLEQMEEGRRERLGWWLCERQLECGGFNGRPDKLEDVCYSWWVLSSVELLGMQEFIDGERLAGFIGRCQDADGGIADREGDRADVFHTFFGLGGLSLLGDGRLSAIDAAHALPRAVVDGLRGRGRGGKHGGTR